MPDAEGLPQTDSLGPSDVRWLQSEFKSTRDLQVALNSATNTRLEEHHGRISAVERYISTRDQQRSARRKRLTIGGVAGLILGAIGAGAQVFPLLHH